MPFCSQCGAQLQDNMRFCPSCGSKAVVVETSVSLNPTPMVDSIQEKNNIRNQNLNEINRMIEYFGQKSALYDEIEVQCLPESIVLKLSEKWDCDLMDMMHVASDEELEKYPFLD